MTSLPPLQHQSQFWTGLVALVGFAVLVLLGVFLDNPIVIGVSVAFGFVSLIFVIVVASMLRFDRKWLAPLVAGDCVAHWVFSEQEWEQHIARAQKRQQSDVPQYLLMGMIVAVLLGAGIILMGVFAEGKSWTQNWREVLFFTGGILGLFLLAGLAWDIYQRLRVRAWRSCSEVYIGRTGLYLGGEMWPSRWGNPRFKALRYEAIPSPLLIFDFEILLKGGSRYIEEVPVPVPPSRHDVAQQIVAWVQQNW